MKEDGVDLTVIDQKMLGRHHLGQNASKWIFYPDDAFKKYFDLIVSW
jgi:hypothetical protein